MRVQVDPTRPTAQLYDLMMLLAFEATFTHHLSHLHYMESADSLSKASSLLTENSSGSSPSLVAKEDMSVTAVADNRRPKLSLQTTSLPSPYVKRSIGLSLPSSAVEYSTPTTSNTIANSRSLDIPLRPSPTASPSRRKPAKVVLSRPYIQPFNIKSILKNGPVSPLAPSSAAASRPGKRSFSLFSADTGSPQTSRRVFFPTVKRVQFEDEDKMVSEITARQVKKSRAQAEDFDDEKLVSGRDGISSDSYAGSGGNEGKAAGLVHSSLRSCRERSATPPPLSSVPESRKRARHTKWEWTIEASSNEAGDGQAAVPEAEASPPAKINEE